MTKQELIKWMEDNPGLQQTIERMAGLSAGYLSKLKNKEIEPFRSTLKLIELTIDSLKKSEK